MHLKLKKIKTQWKKERKLEMGYYFFGELLTELLAEDDCKDNTWCCPHSETGRQHQCQNY